MRRQTPNTTPYEPRNRLKPRTESEIRWVELLDKFKHTQEKTRRHQMQYMTKPSSVASGIEGNSINTAMNQSILTPQASAASASSAPSAVSSSVKQSKGGLGIGKFRSAATGRIRK